MENREPLDKFNVSVELIRQTVSQVEKLEEEKAEIQVQIKESFDNAKSHGLDIAVLKQLIRLRKKKKEAVIEQEELLELYKMALER